MNLASLKTLALAACPNSIQNSLLVLKSLSSFRRDAYEKSSLIKYFSELDTGGSRSVVG
jgi:hypothetical protein